MKIPKGFDKDAWMRVGGLSCPSKLPGYAYSLPAKNCLTGAKLVSKVDSVCSSCYALKGRYNFPNVKNALERRLKAITEPGWVADMTTLVWNAYDQGFEYFRWHDSGDLQSLWHLLGIEKIAYNVRMVTFWLPTREIQITGRLIGDRAPNLIIRESCHFVDQWYPSKAGNPTSTVHKNSPPIGYACPAPTQGNSCGACRACWDPTVKNVSYHKH